jgi:hypothetical protein
LMVTGWSLCPEITSGSGGGACTAPSAPANKTLPTGAIGGTLTANVFYAPPASTVPATTLGTTATTPATTGTTPATTPTTSTTPTAAASAPAS